MRAISATLEALATLEVERRAPAFRVEVYDLRSSTDNTINDIVSGFALESIVGPRDFSDNTVSVAITEAAGDYAQGGISASVATLTLQDETGLLNPFGVIASLTTTAITSVTDSSGTARFNFTGVTLVVGTEVQISGYVTNLNYNVASFVTETDGSSYFEIEGLAFGSSETVGVFSQPVDARFFRSDNVIRIFEGDEAAPVNEWPNTLTLIIQGQVGYERSRAVGQSGVSTLIVKGVTREASYLGFTSITREFTNGETFLTIGTDIAEDEMGLNAEEIAFTGWGTTTTLRHASTTLADEPPIVLLARVMFVEGFLPRFQGDGKLTQQLAILSGGVDRVYEDKRGISKIGWPLSEVQASDTVVVRGLDFNLARVDQPRQVVAEASVTTGYFTQNERIKVLFSPDKSVLADDISLKILRSVNGGMTRLGGGESLSLIPAPNDVGGSPEGFVGVRILISTGYAPWIATMLLVTYAALSAVPDIVQVTGFIVSVGFTINVGGIAAAVALMGAMILMTALGRGQYEIFGTPFEYVFPEIVARAKLDTAAEFSENVLDVSNHMVDNATTAATLAKEILFLEQARKHPRSISAVHDIALEPGDDFTTLDDDRSYYIKSMTRVLTRTARTIEVQMECYETTANIQEAG